MDTKIDFVDRYITEVGRHLPEKTRADIQQEIRSLVEAALEDRAAKAGRPADEEMVIEVLKEFGSPEEIAASYQPARYLVGPRLYPAFITVVKIAIPVIAILAAVRFAMAIGQVEVSPGMLLRAVIEGLADLLGTLLQVLGNIVLVFAILEWFVPGLKVQAPRKDWDPRTLPKPAAAPERVSLVGLSFEIAISMIALVVFNFYPQWIGIGFSSEDWTVIPVLADVFFSRYLFWINVVLALQIALDAILVGRGRWEVVTTWFYVLVKALSAGLALVMLTGPSLIGITADTLASRGPMGLGEAQILVSLLKQVVTAAVILVVVIDGIDLVRQAYRMFFKKAPPLEVKANQG
jgi:hypothetical protein